MPSNLLLSLLVSLSFSAFANAGEGPDQPQNRTASIPGDGYVSFVVRYGSEQLSAQSLNSRSRYEVVSIATDDAEGYAANLKQHPGVLSVEPNYPVSNPTMPRDPISLSPQIMSTQSNNSGPNDPAFTDQYAWQAPTQQYPGVHDILAAAQESPQRRKVRIGVTDSGFHQVADLVFTGGYNFSTIDGPGQDFYTRQIDPSCNDSHGTAVAGIVAATTNNYDGIAGIVDADIYAARVMSCGTGYLHDLAKGIYWLSGQPTESASTLSEPVDIINASMGASSRSCPTYLQDAINFATSKGILVVVAAGNDGIDVSGYIPANCNNVITVGSVSRSGEPSDFSNHGDGIDVAALGELVRTLDGHKQTSFWFRGTSFAAPNVAGVAGLLKQQAPALSPDRIAVRIKESARYPQIFDTGLFRGGILDANRMTSEFQAELAEVRPEFKPALANAERCHRSAYLQIAPDPQHLEALIEVNTNGISLHDASAYFTVFQRSTDQSIENATAIISSQESKFLIRDVDPTQNIFI